MRLYESGSDGDAAHHSTYDEKSIAVVGLSCRFPGDATNSEQFWELLCEGRSAISHIPRDRWNSDGFYCASKGRQNTSITTQAHFLKEDVSVFDAKFFSITQQEATSMDPQQRLLLEVSYEAFENAGVPLEKLAKSKTGCFISAFTHDWREMQFQDPDFAPMYSVSGLGTEVLANRISWFYDLKGPSMTIETACSGSLVGLHVACQSLRSGDCDTALVGGANLFLSPNMFNALSNQGFLSPDGLCKAFDASADGYGRGEGFAALVLKPVEKAIRDGDTIRAIIRGSATNQDGKTRSMTMPNGEAQEELIREAYRFAGLDFKDTSYFEAHGTGTSAGDFAELNAIANTITHERDKPLWVGSVKTNIGHLESVAGLAGIIKSIQILEHGLIPPSLHFHNPNPRIPFKEWRISVPTKEIPWPEEGIRRISVNSFGFGGSNAHIILDDAYHYLTARGIKAHHNTIQTSPKGREALKLHKEALSLSSSRPQIPEGHKMPYMMILSSSDQNGLNRQRQALFKYLKDHAKMRNESGQAFLRDLAFSLSERRSRLPWKTVFTASTVPELTQALEAPTSLEVRSNIEPRLAFVFTGQGAQWARMGIELLQYRIFRESVESAERYLRKIGCPWSVMEELQREDAVSNINQPLYSQTICTVLQVAIIQLLTSWNIAPHSVVGHSSGEIAAAFAIGAISREDAWKVAYWRGKLSSELLKSSPDLTGSMMAVGASAEQAQKWLDELTEGKCVVACINSPSSVTISGDEAGIDELAARLKEREIFARKLKVDTAYHSHHMLAVKDPYTKALANMETRQGPPDGPQMFTSVTGHIISAGELGPSHWVTNLTSPVLFSDAVRELLRPKSHEDQSHGCSVDIMVEIGPHSALQGPIRQILSGFGAHNTEYRSVMSRGKNAVDTILTAVCDLVSRNVPADILAINTCSDDSTISFNSSPALIVDLPSYTWNKTKSYWNESRLTRQIKQRSSPRLSLIGAPLPSFAQLEQQWRGFVRIAEEPWLRDHKIQGSIRYPTASYIAMALEAANQVADQGRTVNRYKLRDINIRNSITIDEGSQTEFITRLRASTPRR
ncbi:Type I Iterative PKS [Trichoderma atroviride]|uniref:Type I Iterative PKS n=1 Tax=Hypocrea atroviridis TaxID=63577 RepID=UPI00333018E1|nr:Type I Iterative PKS [Trichoderma atroviride]